MDLSVESLIPVPSDQEAFADCSESLHQWDEAYRRVEGYFLALGIDNKLLLSSLVLKILGRASDQHDQDPARDPITLAAAEADRYLVSWFRRVLGEEGAEPEDRLSARGRLALLLVQHEVPWQQLFISDEPVPETYRIALQRAYLQADPEFSFLEMQPRPIDLGIVDAANRAFEKMGRFRSLVQWALWLGGAIGFATLFYLTRP
ncbi:MAG: hypothetical protein AAF236_00520 [Verrucomicrobiota bacterium]